MEERLFWIGLIMGFYAWGTRRWAGSGRLDSRLLTSAWHGLFCALSGFGAALVLVMSWDSRSRFQASSSGALSLRELYPSLAGGLALGLWGAWRAWSRGKDAAGREHYRTEDLEWAETVFSAVLLAAVMMYFVVQAFKIPSGSMRSTLLEGDHLFVNKFVYGLRVPFTGKRLFRMRPVRRGDVVVFRFPGGGREAVHCGSDQRGKDFIKRVIGLPGDEVRVTDGNVSVNGRRLAPEPYAQYVDPYRQPRVRAPWPPEEYQSVWESRQLDARTGDAVRDFFGPVRVPKGSYFMMGDNRDRSCDSRFWGPVPDGDIKGKAWMVYWPPSRMGAVR